MGHDCGDRWAEISAAPVVMGHDQHCEASDFDLRNVNAWPGTTDVMSKRMGRAATVRAGATSILARIFQHVRINRVA